MIELYPDQLEIIEKVAASMRRGNRHVLMQSATGSGKTIMATELIRRAQDKGSRTWFTVPRRELIRQTSATLQDFTIPHGMIAAGFTDRGGHAVVNVCSTGTLTKRIGGPLPKPQLAIIDETHYGGEGLDTIIKWLKSHGTYIIGLSATPWKLSGQGLGCWYDDMVCGPSIRTLIDAGRLSEYRGFAPDNPDLSGIKCTGGDYNGKQLDERMRSDRKLIGNAVAHYKQHAMGKLAVVYCVSIDHSKQVADAFMAAGIPAAHIDGTTPDDERKRIIASFARRELLVLCNCELLTFGFDLASQAGMDVTIEAMFDLRPTKSLALQMQKWGRVLRRKDFPALIFDHANNFNEHGMPCDDRDWTLESREKRNGAGGEKSIPVRQCPKCYRAHRPSPICPGCGFEYPIEARQIDEIEGELQEIKAAQEKKVKRIEVGRAQTLDELRRIARDRGYSAGWVWKQAQLKGIRA